MTGLRKIAEAGLHKKDGRFTNPLLIGMDRNLLDILKWKLACINQFRDMYRYEKRKPVKLDLEKTGSRGGLSVTLIKHACVFINDGDKTILVDPVLFPLPGVRNFTPLKLRSVDFPAPDYLLITHDHPDHLDPRTLRLFQKSSRLITPLGYRDVIHGYSGRRIELDWFGSFTDGMREIISLPCNHWCFRNPLRGRNASLWCSYLIKTSAGRSIFIAGDTGYHNYFADIGSEFEIDLAIFNLSAYEPRWFMKPAHMNPEETVRAFLGLGAKKMMIVHWGSFRLGDEPVWLPPLEIRMAMENDGEADKLIHLEHGETLHL